MTAYILGGGPTGLAAAQVMSANGIPFVLLEQEHELGGMARTVSWNGYGQHDLGPHKIFTTDKTLWKRIKGLLPESQWLTRPKKSSIFMKGHYLPYPPSPFSLINVYGPYHFSKMAANYGVARIKSLAGGKTPATFEEDLSGRLGKSIYEALFKPIALKLWGDPQQLDVKLSKARVQTPSMTEVLSRMLKIKKTSAFEALEFDYPKGGIQKLWEAIRQNGASCGKFMTGCSVVALVSGGEAVSEIRFQDESGAENSIQVEKDDFIFSTLPLQKLPRYLGNALERETAILIDKYIKLNDLTLVFFKMDSASLLDESWVFAGDPAIVFHRLSEQESFDPGMTPGGSIVCCEIMSNKARPLNKLSDQETAELARKGLAEMGYMFSIKDRRVIRLPQSYPVFVVGFEAALDKILARLDGFSNFRTIGRQGAFNYIGTLDAMDIGYGAGEWFVKGIQAGHLSGGWNLERERTRHYPVLD